MTSSDVPADGQPVGRISIRPQSVRLNVGTRHAPSLGRWPATRRLVAVSVLAILLGLAGGGLRAASEVSAAAGFARTTQLAVLGQRVTALAQALENERDRTVAYMAAGGWDRTGSLNGVPIVSASAYTADRYAMIQAQGATDAAAQRVRALAGQIGGSFAASAQSQAQQVVTQISYLGGLRSQSGQTSLSAIANYSQTLAALFSLNEQITSGSADAVLNNGVAALDALSRAKDQASQQRAILEAALIDGSFGQQAEQSLLTSQALENAYLLTFQSSATGPELNAYVNTMKGRPVDTAQLMSNYVTQISGGRPLAEDFIAVLQVPAASVPALWYSAMSGTIDRMRAVESQVAAAVVARSRALRQGAVRSAAVTTTVTGAVVVVLLIATFLAARTRDATGRPPLGG